MRNRKPEESEDPPEAPELSFYEELALAHYSQRSPRVADEQEITAAEEAAGLEIPADRDCAVAFETDDGDSAVVALWLDRPAAEEDLLGVLEGAGLNMKHLPAEGYTSMQADKGEVSVLLTVIEDTSSAMSNWSMLIPDSAVATLAILFP